MARAVRLKVYRTPIGFHDAYVAASSQKAALEAWGSAHDLFQTGEAEVVTDPALMQEPLARPGAVVRRARGTTAEHIAALPPEVIAPVPDPPPTDLPAVNQSPAGSRRAQLPKAATRQRKPRPPKPDKTAVDAAKADLRAIADQHADAVRKLKHREAELRSERQALEQSHREAMSSAQASLDAAQVDYRRANEAWKAVTTPSGTGR